MNQSGSAEPATVSLLVSCPRVDCLEHSWDWGDLERSENHPGGGAFITSVQNGMACVREAAFEPLNLHLEFLHKETAQKEDICLGCH